MTTEDQAAHEREINDQFSRQAAGFAAAKELHADDVVALVVEAARPKPGDKAIDLCCGTGSVACAIAKRAEYVVGLDATESMLDKSRDLARREGIGNVEWRAGDVYQTPFADGSFDIVTCRFAFHHLEHPALAFAEMVRLATPGGRVVLCDAYASDDPEKAAAFNAMDVFRDPSTAGHRPLAFLRRLFEATGLGDPEIVRFEVPYLAHEFVARSFPLNDDRAGLLAMIEASVDGDTMDLGARRSPEGVRFVFRSAVLSAVKAGFAD
jgi:ubiquinone/menaquinone biosynthesis C-methylase UbiE